MEKQYKIDLINSLYGIIEGAFYAADIANRHFKQKYPELQFKISQQEISRTINFLDFPKQSSLHHCFAGCVTLILTINNESFSVERDWGIEALKDTKHPDYFSDDFFYDSDKCYSYKKSQELINCL